MAISPRSAVPQITTGLTFMDVGGAKEAYALVQQGSHVGILRVRLTSGTFDMSMLGPPTAPPIDLSDLP